MYRAAPSVAHEEVIEHRACRGCQAGHTMCAPQPAISAQLTPGHGHGQQHQEAQQGQSWGRETVFHQDTFTLRTRQSPRRPQSRQHGSERNTGPVGQLLASPGQGLGPGLLVT